MVLNETIINTDLNAHGIFVLRDHIEGGPCKRMLSWFDMPT